MTGVLKAKVGTEWVDALPVSDNAALQRWNGPWGVIAKGTMSTPIGGRAIAAGVTDVLGLATPTIVAGRRYRITMYCRAWGAAGANPGRWTLGGIVDTTAGLDAWAWSAGQWDSCNVQWLLTAEQIGLGARPLTVSIINGGSAMTVWLDTSFFIVEDVGPQLLLASQPPVSAGVPVVAAGNALGIVAMGSTLQTGMPLTIGTGTIVTNPLSCTMHVGRRYRIVVNGRAFNGASASLRYSVYDSTGTPAILPGTTDQYNSTSTSYGALHAEWIVEGDGVTRTIDVRAWLVAGTPSVYMEGPGTSAFYVEDMGPNSAPALPVPVTPPAWTALTLNAGWVNSIVGSPAQYRKVGDVVEVRFTLGFTPGTGNPFATLPVGFRATREVNKLAGYMDNGGVPVSPFAPRLTTNSTGQMSIMGLGVTAGHIFFDGPLLSTTP